MNYLRTALTTLLLPAGVVIAQEAPVSEEQKPAKSYRQDIGVFAQSGGPLKEGEGTFSVNGVMYRWAKPRTTQTFWKMGAGIGSSFAIPVRRTQPVSSDSAFNIELWKDERVYMLLGGVETQRQLWKKVYITAGLEVQAGGSNGRLDSVGREIPEGANTVLNGPVIGSPQHIADTWQLFGSGLAMLGVRAYAGRFTGAFELFTGASMTAQTQTLTRDIPGRTHTAFNFNLGGAGTRFSLGYRF